MLRRGFLLIAMATLPPAGALAQSGSSDFREVALSQIPENAGIADEMGKQEQNHYLFVPPIFRYRISVEATGKIEPLNTDETDTLKKWGIFVGRPDFVSLFEHKVEVQASPAPLWILWQKTLVQPFREELSQGGKLIVKTLLIGARYRQPLLLAIGFQSS